MRPMKWGRAAAAVLVVMVLATACSRGDDSGGAASTTQPAADGKVNCAEQAPEATDVGITADSITIEVMADVGSPLSPGLFQANLDAVKGFAKMINANGGIACRQLVVKTWDSKLSAEEAKNGLIDACQTAFAMVGSNAVFNPDVSPLVSCPDKTGQPVGLPDIAASAVDVNQLCNSTTYLIQPVTETCPVAVGQVRPIRVSVGSAQWHLEQNPGLHGLFLVPGDLPTTVQAATYQIEALEKVGIVFDGTPKVSGRAEQAALTPIAQLASDSDSTFVFNGANDSTMLKMRRETLTQGYDGVEVWACNSCYTKAFLASPDVAEGTYVDLPFLPFEERDTNQALDDYLTAVGEDHADNFGAAAWQAAMLFQEAVEDVVAADGVNGLTRAALLGALSQIHEFDAGGWLGPKDPRGVSECFMTVQVQGGKFVRVHPTEPGTFDCNADNVITVQLDPAAEAAKLS